MIEDGTIAYAGTRKAILLDRAPVTGRLRSVWGIAIKETFSSENWYPASLNAKPTSLSLGKAV